MTRFSIEIPRAEIKVDNVLLGEGEFGEVRKGLWQKTKAVAVEVAVKVLKERAREQEQESFIKEGRRMVHLHHAHVVQLLGIVREGGFMLVTELVKGGALRKVLRARNKKKDPISLPTLLLFISQIADGMAYLEDNSLVHRDLAARNILMESEAMVKISDFGMSRQIENYYNSSRTGSVSIEFACLHRELHVSSLISGVGLDWAGFFFFFLLFLPCKTCGAFDDASSNSSSVWPLKWYAPECIYESKFTSKGDVWSFGICSWEILSHGKKPYSEFSQMAEVVAFAIEGRGRLAIPDGCPESVYVK